MDRPSDWGESFERERARYDDGLARLDPAQLVRIGNAAYGAGLTLLMLGRGEEARGWFERAATRWRESWEHADPTAWGRPVGVIKAALLGADGDAAATHARWALELGCEEAESPIGRYAATLALLTLGHWKGAGSAAATLRGREDFPPAVADALALISGGDAVGFATAVEAVLASFEIRDAYLEDVAVADTVIVLQALAARRGIAAALPSSPVLPG